MLLITITYISLTLMITLIGILLGSKKKRATDFVFASILIITASVAFFQIFHLDEIIDLGRYRLTSDGIINMTPEVIAYEHFIYLSFYVYSFILSLSGLLMGLLCFSLYVYNLPNRQWLHRSWLWKTGKFLFSYKVQTF